MGRKSLLHDKARIDRLVDALLAANTIRNACDLSAIGETTFHRWMQKGENAPEGSPLREFRGRIKRAMAEAQHRNVLIIQKAAATNWQAAAWFLERTRPDEWGRKSRLALSGDPEGSPILTANVGVQPERPMTEQELLAVMEAVVAREKEKAERGKQDRKFETVAKAA